MGEGGRNPPLGRVLGGPLLLQQLVNPLQIVKGVIDEEAKFWDDAQLITDTGAEFVTYLLLICLNVLDNLLATLRREHAKVSCAYTEVWRDTYTSNTYQHTRHHACLCLEY